MDRLYYKMQESINKLFIEPRKRKFACFILFERIGNQRKEAKESRRKNISNSYKTVKLIPAYFST